MACTLRALGYNAGKDVVGLSLLLLKFEGAAESSYATC